MRVFPLIVGAALLLGAAAPAQDAPRDQGRKNAYVVELKLLEVAPDGSTRVYTHPHVATLEHEPARVEIASEPHVLHPQIVDEGDKLKIGTSFVLKIKRLDAERVLLQLNVQHNEVRKAQKHDTQIVGNTLRAVKRVEVGKPVKFVLSSDRKGKAQRWVEATVKQGLPADPAPPALGASQPQPAK